MAYTVSLMFRYDNFPTGKKSSDVTKWTAKLDNINLASDGKTLKVLLNTAVVSQFLSAGSGAVRYSVTTMDGKEIPLLKEKGDSAPSFRYTVKTNINGTLVDVYKDNKLPPVVISAKYYPATTLRYWEVKADGTRGSHADEVVAPFTTVSLNAGKLPAPEGKVFDRFVQIDNPITYDANGVAQMVIGKHAEMVGVVFKTSSAKSAPAPASAPAPQSTN